MTVSPTERPATTTVAVRDDPDVALLRRRIETERDQLARTVTELVDRVDVKRRVRERAGELRDSVSHGSRTVMIRAGLGLGSAMRDIGVLVWQLVMRLRASWAAWIMPAAWMRTGLRPVRLIHPQ